MPSAQDALWLDVLPSMKGFASRLASDSKSAAQSAGNEAGTSMGSNMKKKLLAAFGATALGTTVAKAFIDGMNIDAANDKLAASLGLTEETSRRAGKVAGDLYRDAYGESMGDTTKAVEAVMSSIEGMTDASSEDLERVTAKALDFAAVFEIDVPRATQVAGQLIKSGLAKDADEAFDLMTASSQQVPEALRGDLLDAVDEYGPAFASLGYDGEEAFGLLVAGAEKGAYGIDKTGDAIKEFTIRSTDMSTASVAAYDAIGLNAEDMANKILAGGDSSRQATDDVIEGLLNIEDPAERANAAIALFGTPLEDLSVSEIPSFLEGMKSTESTLGDVEGAAENMGTTLNDNFSTRLESWKRSALGFGAEGMLAMIEGFESGKSSGEGFFGVMSHVGVGLKKTVTFLTENKDAVLALAAGIGVATVGFVGMSILTSVTTWIAGTTLATKGLNAALRANPIGLVITAIGLLVAGLVYLYKTNDTARAIIQKAWSGIKSAASAVTTWFTTTAWPVMSKVLAWIGAKALWLWAEAIQPAFNKVWSKAKFVFSWFRETGLPWMQKALSGVASAVSSMWSKASDTFTKFKSGLTSLKDKFSSIRDKIGDIWSGLPGKISAPIRTVIKYINDKFIGGINRLLSKVGVKEIPLIPVPGVAATKTDAAATGGRGGSNTRLSYLADGGDVPGWSPSSVADNIPAMLTAKEFVTRVKSAESMRRLYPGVLEFINRHGRLPAQYAGGGSVGDEAGGGVTDWLTDLAGAPLRKLKEKLTGFMSGLASNSPFAQAAVGGLKSAGSGIASWLKSKIFGSDAAGGGGSVPADGTFKDILRLAAPFGAAVTSTVRGGAKTATGFVSRHALGKAVDFAPVKALWDFFYAMRGTFRELYGPWGLYRYGKPRTGPGQAVTAANHSGTNAHIHAAYSGGGEVTDPQQLTPKLYDTGGVLPPGDTWVRNSTGHNEYVINPALTGRGQPVRPDQHYHFEAADADDVIRKIDARRRDAEALLSASPL
ncbi:hypothetical protein K0651_01840 [Ornithinimicrobium sp. Arc0846-15]|nr:hypothetical protein [Ornithinimicrobium laminariae]